MKILIESEKKLPDVNPKFIAGYQYGVIDAAEKIRSVLTSEIDRLMDELQIDASGSATIEADRDGFNRGIMMLGNKLKRHI